MKQNFRFLNLQGYLTFRYNLADTVSLVLHDEASLILDKHSL
jgi:hypothetical protein